jgi:hypothetical protein
VTVATDDEIQNALLAIHSRLGTIEGKLNLVARAEREAILDAVQGAIAKDCLLGQIYLLIDGKRTQQEILAELTSFGITPSQSTVSRRMSDLVTEYGIADEVRLGNVLVLRKNRAAEDILNLGRRVRRWLEEGKQVVPERAARRPRKSAK